MIGGEDATAAALSGLASAVETHGRAAQFQEVTPADGGHGSIVRQRGSGAGEADKWSQRGRQSSETHVETRTQGNAPGQNAERVDLDLFDLGMIVGQPRKPDEGIPYGRLICRLGCFEIRPVCAQPMFVA